MKQILIFLGIFFLGITLLFVLWNVFFSGRNAVPEKRAAADIFTLSTQLDVYREAHGYFPTTEQGLKVLVSKPTIEPIPEHWEQLLDSIPTDGWGRRYQYRYPGLHNKDSFDLFSLGENAVDPSDDIGNWNLESFR